MRRPGVGASALVALLALVAGCASSDGSRPDAAGDTARPGASSSSVGTRTGPLARFYDQRLSWSDCRRGFECARLLVPIDYGAPRGRPIKIAVVRLPAQDGDPRGSVILNPGGPGASGVDYARAAESVVSQAVRKRYDVVGFDPRGVARSAPIDCVSDRRLDVLVALDGSPDDEAEERAVDDQWRSLGAGCESNRPALTAHMGTRDVARDLDVLRVALGDPRLTYIGKSYGTYLGTTYAEMFPRKVGRMVLDGQVDPAASSSQLAAGQAAGFQRAFRSFLTDCVRRSSCPLDGDVDAAQAQVGALLDRVDATPLKAEPGRPVTQGLAVLGVAAALYDQRSWPLLRQALGEAKRGRGDMFLSLADFYSDRGPNGHYTTNSVEALYAVNCLDRPEATDLAEFRSEAAKLAASSPVFGAYIAWGGLPCATWPVPAQGSPHPVAAAGAAPILVVGTTRDPATPYAASVAVAGQLESGRLLTYVGDGHTAYRRGSACIDQTVDRYLLDGQLPPAGTRCR